MFFKPRIYCEVLVIVSCSFICRRLGETFSLQEVQKAHAFFQFHSLCIMRHSSFSLGFSLHDYLSLQMRLISFHSGES